MGLQCCLELHTFNAFSSRHILSRHVTPLTSSITHTTSFLLSPNLLLHFHTPFLLSYTGHMRFIGEIYMYGLVKQSVMKHCVLELINSPEVRIVRTCCTARHSTLYCTALCSTALYHTVYCIERHCTAL